MSTPGPTYTATPSATAYDAGAFHPDYPSGRTHGQLILDTASARFDTADGRSFPLPYRGLQLSLGGASDRLVFVSHPSVPDLSIFVSDQGLLKHPRLADDPAFSAQLAAISQKKTRNWTAGLGFIAAVIALIFGLFLLKNPIIGVVASLVPAKAEIALGDSLFPHVAQNLIEDDELDAELEAMAAQLLSAIPDNRYPFDFHLAEETSINAFALPGGNVVVHTGLILKAERPEEVLGVLAHEIAHVTRRHSLRNIIGTLGVVAIIQTALGDASGLVALAAEGGRFLLTQGFSREYERDADDTGWEYLLDAGIDPRGLISFFEKIQAEYEQELGEGAEDNMSFLSTHPSSQERIERLTRKWEESGFDQAPRIDPVDFHGFQDKIRQHLELQTSSDSISDVED